MLDRAVFAGCIHTLNDDEQRIFFCSVKDFLKFSEMLDIRLQLRLRMMLCVKRSCRAGIEICQTDVPARLYH